mmetsp:Transcript_18964/g.43034  ORF Transcript_18964/g.43034 Transcript_18964/m.43034 type:complete len:181 (+) Transcript_18964:86-628(+)
MLLPIPAMPAGPSPFAKSMTNWVLAMLIVQSVLCLLRFVLLLDILGGFIMAICVGLGWYAWKEDMNITFICYWGFMGLINGVFGLVQLIDHAVHSPLPMFSSMAPARYNVHAAIRLLQEISMIIGAVLAYWIYRGHDAPEGGGGTWGSNSESRPQAPSRPGWSQPTFNTFGGKGQRLGAA